MVQLREKTLSGRGFYSLALEALALTRPRGIPLIINDRLDIALAAGADGVHLGQGDLPVERARALAREALGGRPFLVGASAHNRSEALAACAAGADYLGCGAVFPTGTKQDIAGVVGVEGLRAVCGAVRIPVLGIGGINAENAPAVMRAGAAGAAVVSAVFGAADPRAAAQALRAALRAALNAAPVTPPDSAGQAAE
jgi:thiamine-phosphate pyrophosphorylase